MFLDGAFIKLAFRNVFRNKGRSVITLLVISSGTMSLILSRGFIEDTLIQVRENYIQDFIGHLRVYQKGYSENGLIHPYDYLIKDPQTLRDRILTIPGVHSVSPRLNFTGLISNGEISLSFMGQGIDTDADEAKRQTSILVSGSILKPDTAFGILLGKGMAQALQATPGTSLVMMGSTQAGGLNALDVNVEGTFGTAEKAYDDHALRLPVQLAQKLVRTSGVESVWIYLDETERTAEVQKKLEALFKAEALPYEIKNWYELPESEFVRKLTNEYKSIFGIIQIIIITVVFLGIVNTMNMIVLERIGEIGTLRAVGVERSQVAFLFMLEGTMIGVLGGLLGTLLAIIIGSIISFFGIHMPEPPGSTIVWIARIELAPHIFILPVSLSIVTALLSSVFPALKAARMDIADALRHNV